MSSDSLHAVLGDDDFIVRQRAQEIFDELAESFPDDLSREIIDGRADRVEDVERILKEAKSACQTLSLFWGWKTRMDKRSEFPEPIQNRSGSRLQGSP